MKEIKAFVRPNKVNEIVQQLKENGFENMTISSAEGTGKFQDDKAFVSQIFSITDSPMAKLEIVVQKEKVDTIVSIISEYGKSLHSGDGIIYVSDVEKAYRVKTAMENGENN
jgi:nitrogen regulatory protein P-II 1